MSRISVARRHLQETYPSMYLAVFHHKNHKNEYLSFDRMHYLIDIYKDNAPEKVLMKSTQSGITEWLIIEIIVDAKFRKRNVFYVMPTDKLKNQFINTRFDRSVVNTELYKGLFKDAEYNNMSVKQIGDASIFFAVSNSRNNFTSFPADTYIVDEMDECNLDNLAMAPERLAFSKDPRSIKVANPTYPDIAIDWEWQKSDQKHWFLTCTHCGHKFMPDFFINVVKEVDKGDFSVLDPDFEFGQKQDARLFCDKCMKPVDRYGGGEWVAKYPSRYISGRNMSQLFTSRKRLDKMIDSFDDALSNEVKMQRFYNGTLGLPYIGRGAQVSDEIINGCIQDYLMPYECKEACVIGIDVGKKMHTTIFRLINNTGQYQMQLVYAGELHFTVTDKCIDIGELTDLFSRYRIVAGIIDARPEDRLARLICQNFVKVWRCIYLSENPKDQLDIEQKIYKTDRTSSMDGVKEQMTLRNMLLPRDIDRIKGFRDQLKAPIRVFEEKESTNGKWVWREGNKADHYFHSVNYANIAKKLLLSN